MSTEMKNVSHYIYKLLVVVLKIQTPSEKPCFIAARQMLWGLHEPEAVKQRVVEYIKSKLGGRTMQLMMLLKKNNINGRSEN